MVPSGGRPRAKDETARNATNKEILRRLGFISMAPANVNSILYRIGVFAAECKLPKRIITLDAPPDISQPIREV
jgi:hypothetical protein